MRRQSDFVIAVGRLARVLRDRVDPDADPELAGALAAVIDLGLEELADAAYVAREEIRALPEVKHD